MLLLLLLLLLPLVLLQLLECQEYDEAGTAGSFCATIFWPSRNAAMQAADLWWLPNLDTNAVLQRAFPFWVAAVTKRLERFGN